MINPFNFALTMTRQVGVAPVMEERRKQKHQKGPSEGREEEAEMSHPHTYFGNNQASVFLAAIEQVPNFG